MSTLAIKGHSTRGSEVIALLEMLGGINKYNLRTTEENLFYYLSKEDNVIIETYFCSTTQKVFTLEEFEEKFPYKVGDKAIFTKYGDKDLVTIQSMMWTGITIEYTYNDYCTCLTKDLQPYKEQEPMEIKPNQIKDKNAFVDISNADYNNVDTIELLCSDKFDVEIIHESKIVLKRKKLTYPSSYKECCKILNISKSSTLRLETESNGTVTNCAYSCSLIHKLSNFRKLLICRDAYWKTAGEQMGLGKPWEPDWKNDEQGRYMIMVYENKLYKDMSIVGTNFILVFPTEEMRDAFYENFKELIENCKELL